MLIYMKLLLAGLVPVGLSVILYLLQKKTPFGTKCPKGVQQVIIGLVFGLAAVAGTEFFGVDIGGATANARDAAPICAGLLFGSPAGVLAGVIGGVERWFSASGDYSRLACTIATLLSGVYAGFLRHLIFEKKRPNPLFAGVTAFVMEIFHMTILLLTHLDNPVQSYSIVRIATLPMVFANVVSLILATAAVNMMGRSISAHKSVERKLSREIQTWLLVIVVVMFFVTTLFSYSLQAGTQMMEAETTMKNNIADIRSEVDSKEKDHLMELAVDIGEEYKADPSVDLSQLAGRHNASWIHILEEKREPQLLPNEREIILPVSDGSYLSIGFSNEMYRNHLAALVANCTSNRRVGSNGYMVVAMIDSGKIVSAPQEVTFASLSEMSLDMSAYEADERIETAIGEEKVLMIYETAEEYYILAIIPFQDLVAEREGTAYVNAFIQVILFAVLFLSVFFLIKHLVVNKIHSVNRSLGKIIDGDLEQRVEVRSSEEFASLSDDINETVESLKHYIDEASARIDRELVFAQNIQHSALPALTPKYTKGNGFNLYASMATAKEVGGDFYDFYCLGKSYVAFLIADVSGKGIPAAMFMMRSKTMLKSLTESGLSIDEVFTKANERLCEGNDAEMFVTAWMGILDLQTGRVRFVNAGHNPPLICRGEEGYSYYKTRAGFVLAGFDGFQYKMQEVQLRPGDKLFLYTDGVTESINLETEQYGEDRLKETLDTLRQAGPEETLAGVKASLEAFVGEAEPFDDVTMLTIEYLGNGEEQMEERDYPAIESSFDQAMDFVSEKLESVDCPMKTQMQIQVAFEEMFINVVHYAYPEAKGNVQVGLCVKPESCTIRLIDSGIAFNPLERQDPNIAETAEERNIGGLGIFMVKKTMDSVSYERENGQNIFTMTKKLL